ncbi:MAG: exopolyphosphatase [Desulfovibrionaceae bacterium]
MRLLTRSDFDGLACAVLIKEMGLLDEWKFVHPKDLQDGSVHVTENDILANVPFVKGCGMWFDHHASEAERLVPGQDYTGAWKLAPSAARVVWEYFGGNTKFANKYDEMLKFVDKVDSGDLTAEEIMAPKGWILLGFIMDPRTGLGRYKDYTVSNYQLMEELIGYCRTLPIDKILQVGDVKERVDRYYQQEKMYREMVRTNAAVHGNVLLIDLRNQEEIYTGNRFTMYTMYPQCNISIQVIWGLKKQNTVFTCGWSIVNRTSNTDVGRLMLQHGGGGHKQVGTCQVPNDQADKILNELIEQMRADG